MNLREHEKPGRATAAYLNYVHGIANNPAEASRPGGRWGSECGSVCCACACTCVCCGRWWGGAVKGGWACCGSPCTLSSCLFWLLHVWHISPLSHKFALQSVGSILSALVPCLRLYAFLGCQLAKALPQEDADHPYSGTEFFGWLKAIIDGRSKREPNCFAGQAAAAGCRPSLLR